MKPAPTTPARRARWAVFALFFTNGALFANVVPRYPEIKDTFGLSDPIYGLTIALFPLGAMLFGPFAGWLIRHFTSARTAAWGTVTVGALLVAAGLCAALKQGLAEGSAISQALPYVGFAVFFLLAGGADAVTDVGQNAHGLRVQRIYGRSIFTSYHGGWSLGAVTGGLMGSAATALNVPLFAHLMVSALIFMVVGLAALRFALPGSDHQEVVGENGDCAGQRHSGLESGSKSQEAAAVSFGTDKQADGDSPVHSPDQVQQAPAQKSVPTMPWPTGVVLALLTLVMIAGMGVEDVASSWSALYSRDYLGTPAAVAGMAYVVLLLAQAGGRFSADRVIDRLGPRPALTLSALIVTVGGLLAWGISEVWALLVGMALVGVGSAAIVPTAMNAADDIPGLKAGSGLTVVTWLGRLAFLCAPPLIGVLVEVTSLRWAVVLVPIYGAVALLASRVLAKTGQQEP